MPVAARDRVTGLLLLFALKPTVGTHAEETVLPADAVARVPGGLDLVDAAALPLTALAARQALDLLGAAAARTLLVTGGPGAVRRLRYRKRRTVTIEPVLEAQPGQRLVYEVTSGLPVRNYRATVELTTTANGTDIEWGATFDRTLRGRVVRPILQHVYEEIVGRLVAAADAARDTQRARG